MPLKVAFELSDRDLRYFRRRMAEVRGEARQREEDEIVPAARALLEQMRDTEVPDFVRERIGKLEEMIEMLEDEEWGLSGPHRRRVLEAMAYFAETEDLIPDQVPGLGFLDDAIMVELVVQELQPELQSYQEFCRERLAEEKRRGKEDPITREEWVRLRRQRGHKRMRERRARRRRPVGRGRRSIFSLY